MAVYPFIIISIFCVGHATCLFHERKDSFWLIKAWLRPPITKEDQDSLPVPQMISNYGYPVETHKVHTTDGYINTLHRIPSSHPNAPVVFLQHGLMGTSADFVMGRPDKSLGYMLSDYGYDVWLGNIRGNKYSREHEWLTTKDSQYWQFSFDEFGQFDVPAAIDFVLLKTKTNKMVYIGHSMGTTMFWVAMNHHPEKFGQHIELMIAMGPVATVNHMKSPIRYIAPYVHEAKIIFELMGVNEFSPSTHLMQLFDHYVCDETMLQLELCENICFLLTGFDLQQANTTLLPIILGHEPGGTSTRTIIHFAQEVNSGRFCHYDYGSATENEKVYNQPTPPDYSLHKVNVPVALMWGMNDWLADPKDVEYLINTLPRIILNYKVPLANFNHIDFLWGLDADTLVYKQIFKLLKKLKH